MGNSNTNTNITLDAKCKKKSGSNSVFIISLIITFAIVFWGILDKFFNRKIWLGIPTFYVFICGICTGISI